MYPLHIWTNTYKIKLKHIIYQQSFIKALVDNGIDFNCEKTMGSMAVSEPNKLNTKTISVELHTHTV